MNNISQPTCDKNEDTSFRKLRVDSAHFLVSFSQVIWVSLFVEVNRDWKLPGFNLNGKLQFDTAANLLNSSKVHLSKSAHF